MNKFPEIPKTQCIIVLAGCPACGKTTLAKEIYANRKDCVIVSRDSIREARGSYNIPEQEDYISDIEEASVRAAIKRGLSPIIDATNLKWRYRDKFKTILAPYNPKIIYVYIEAPTFQDNLKRRKGQIPKDIIIKMRDNFEFPKMTECEELIIEKQGLERFKSFRLKK